MLIGHSGDKIQLKMIKNGYIIQKTGSNRLLSQIEKQIKFYELIKNNNVLSLLFEVPQVLSSQKFDNSVSFTMPFYNGNNILDIFEKGDISYLNNIIEKLIYFLNWEIDTSNKIKFQSDLFLQKSNDIRPKVDKTTNLLLDAFDISIIKQNILDIPDGICHGDFTFSNLIFTNKIILIDFLNTFYDNPLQDIAKLLQEINLQWSFLIDSNRDITKINIGYQYFKKELNLEINKLLTYHKIHQALKIFYLMTLFRLTPYIKNGIIYNRVIHEISNILEDK